MTRPGRFQAAGQQACVSEIRSLLSAEPFDQNETFCRAPPRQAGFVLLGMASHPLAPRCGSLFGRPRRGRSN
jgi:hypothetical protein